ncbi:hypothetical protein NDU88_001503 [Pleurodeles waltl]|uniref:Uncharacterized protein n=1 Tax=Pleurodeles waltl TaxID=8319 RepID=A0AAV7RB18_PLEWA|nr:hypothetical protein NDU88_001503 [Pleurodeles waltl]
MFYFKPAVEIASPDTVNAIDNQERVSTDSSKDSCSEIQYVCKTLEQSSYSDTVVADMVIECGKDENIIEEEVEEAMDFSISMKRKEKEREDTEEIVFKSNDSRDFCTQDERGKFQDGKV